jgi:hypothetical protein
LSTNCGMNQWATSLTNGDTKFQEFRSLKSQFSVN